jgi:CRISPR/Cas system Type II protein with McrA/HNH and RuvC-like nuclease domain
MEPFRKINLNQSVLVLNSDYNPINIADAKKAIKLLIKRKAEFVTEKVIRLINYIYLPISKIRNTKPSRKSIHLRDGNKCGYCNSTRNLTIDHIIPSSRGGKNEYSNLVCCCLACNTKKGNRTPEEANMKLIRKPTEPFNKVHFNIEKSNSPEWFAYIYI